MGNSDRVLLAILIGLILFFILNVFLSLSRIEESVNKTEDHMNSVIKILHWEMSEIHRRHKDNLDKP